jgi:hypothetical protein
LRVVPIRAGEAHRERHASPVTDQMAFAPALGPVGGIRTGLWGDPQSEPTWVAGDHASVTTLLTMSISAAAQEYAGREKLRAQSNEFRKEVIRVTNGIYVAVGYACWRADPKRGRDECKAIIRPRGSSYKCRCRSVTTVTI